MVDVGLVDQVVLHRLGKLELQLRALARLIEFAVEPKLILVDYVVVLLGLVVREEQVQRADLVLNEVLLLVNLDDAEGGEEASLPAEVVYEPEKRVEERVRKRLAKVLVILEDVANQLDLPEILLDLIKEKIDRRLEDVLVDLVALTEMSQTSVNSA